MAASKQSMFAVASCGLAGIFILGLLCVNSGGFPFRFDSRVLECENARQDHSFIQEMTADQIRSGAMLRIGAIEPGLAPAVFVWGDSHAMAALPAIDALLTEKGIAGRAATHSGWPPLVEWFKSEYWYKNEQSVDYNDAVLEYLRKTQIRDVILIASWTSYQDGPSKYPESFYDSLTMTVKRLQAIGCRPWILLSVPVHKCDVPRALSRSVRFYGDVTRFCGRPEVESDGMNPAVIAELRTMNVRILDPKPAFLDSTGRYYLMESESIVLYRDYNHLTTKGSIAVLLPFLRSSWNLDE